MIDITEGVAKKSESEDYIRYPEITSCLTVTCIYTGGGFVGGHLVKVAVPPKLEYTRVLDNMSNLMTKMPGTLRYLYIVGQLQVWSADQKAEIIARLKPYTMRSPKAGMAPMRMQIETHYIDTTRIKSVNVAFNRNGNLRILDRASDQLLLFLPFGAKSELEVLG
jgi:hypothetical protein